MTRKHSKEWQQRDRRLIRLHVAFAGETKDAEPSRTAARRRRTWGWMVLAVLALLGLSPKSWATDGRGSLMGAETPSWPPIEQPQFRADLLERLARNPSAPSKLSDVTATHLTVALSKYCNMPEELRIRLDRLNYSRFVDGVFEAESEIFRRECHMTIYAQQHRNGVLFVVLYASRIPRDRAIFVSRRAGSAIAVSILPVGHDPAEVLHEAGQLATAALNHR